MVDFGESDKMIKISGKVDKSDRKGLVIFRSSFTNLLMTKHFLSFSRFYQLRK